MALKHSKFDRSSCPIACTLDLIGDKWTMLVIRDLLLGKSRFGEFLNSSEAIPTNILTERLKRLVRHEIVSRQPYQSNPIRFEYRLTEKGRDLSKVILEMVRWGERHIPGTETLLNFDRKLLDFCDDRL